MVAEQQTTEYTLDLAGVRVGMTFQYPETAKQFHSCVPGNKAHTRFAFVTEADWKQWRDLGNEPSPYGEYSLMSIAASDALMPFDRFVFHCAAVRLWDRAWLITAGSGVGKSTQARTLLELYPEEASVINGDRPVLELREDGTVMAHPSPWNGKENMRGAAAAPLGGIILLRRGDENAIERIKPRKAAPHVYMSIFQTYDSEESIRRAGALAARLAEAVPIWQLTNKGVPDSTRLLYETIREEVRTDGI